MIKGMNAGLQGELYPPGDVDQLVAMKLGGVRQELMPEQGRDAIAAILAQYVGRGLAINLLLHGERMGTDALCVQLETALAESADLGVPLSAVEPENEPNLHDRRPDEVRETLNAVAGLCDRLGFDGAIYGGSISNPTPEGLDYARAMQWDRIPQRVSPAWHLYPVHGDMSYWHSGSLHLDVVNMMETTRGPNHPPAITETGIHTARNTPTWHKTHGFLKAHRYTDEDVAGLMVPYLTQLAQWGIPRCDYFQWNDGVPKDECDYEAMFGVRDVTGQWKPQGIALAQIGEL